YYRYDIILKKGNTQEGRNLEWEKSKDAKGRLLSENNKEQIAVVMAGNAFSIFWSGAWNL
ncbi:MAG: hypothetical protein K2G19_12080, partial [Lachnospiraceae bacterium]|nr:hypothetical protein [Lachnospiraceae bacterium]